MAHSTSSFASVIALSGFRLPLALGDLEAIGALALQMRMNGLLKNLGEGLVFEDAEQFQGAMLAVIQRDGDPRQRCQSNKN